MKSTEERKIGSSGIHMANAQTCAGEWIIACSTTEHMDTVFSCPDRSMLIYIQKKYDTAPGIASAPLVNFFPKLYEEWLDNSYHRELSPDSIFYNAKLAAIGDTGHVN